jgi:chromosome segregation protein
MKLTRLELSGFKSFADTIELPFEDGMTCVVGPNGCGKSNVSDAVRWVMGEQRPRVLRGTRMEEVIFQGSVKRKPLNIAEVSLVFDNVDGKLPIAYQEVVVTRRLSRSGQSDYLINQSPARLKDVQDLLRGTGLGSDAGVVIEARMIDRLLSDRAEERRSLFEEAAGIGLYRDRATITERRLEKTLDDLQRLDDLISEVSTQVRSLARQRGKAERHRTFTAERFAVVMELARRDLAAFESAHRDFAARRVSINEELPRAREALSAAEREREARVQARATTEAQRAEVHRLLGERRVEVGKLEGDLNLANERLHNATSRRNRAGEEREQVEAAAKQAKLELDAASDELSAARSARESVQMELDLRAASEDESRSRLSARRERVRELEATLQQLAENRRALAGERSALEGEIEDLRAQSTELERRVRATREALDNASSGIAAAQSRLQVSEETDRKAQGELERARHALAAAREHETALVVERRNAEEQLAQQSARAEALEALEQERAGLAPGARRLLETRARFGSDAVLGPLSDYLRTDAKGAIEVARILGDWLHAVVVRDESVVEAIRQWHEETRPGPIVLLPLDPGPRAGGAGGASWPNLEVQGPVEGWARALLAEHHRAGGTPGVIHRANGAVFLPGADDPSGPLARRAELDALRAGIADLEPRFDRLTQAVTEATAAHHSCQVALDQETDRCARARTALQESKGALDDAMREEQRCRRDHVEVSEALARLAQRLNDREQRLAAVLGEIDTLSKRHREVEADLTGERTGLANAEAEQETARERRVHWQVEEAQVSAREAAAREREARATSALLRAEETRARLVHEIEEIDGSSSGLVEQRAGWTESLSERRAQFVELERAAAEAEANVQAANQRLSECERQLEEGRTRVHQFGEEVHRVELEQTELTGRRRALTERMEAEWNRPLDELLAAAEPVDGDDQTLRDEAQRLRDAIEAVGPVNPLAAQEYEEEKTRLDFLQSQREDLVAARASLGNALREIDQTARQLFVETFDQVREHFHTVFRTLFEGGECDVRLADPNDPLMSDIEIRAAPRGKRTQRIHLLSSGERALVAISLLFAIYLTKPSPFCLLDEVDAPLDDANVQRFIRLITEFKDDTQFIVITHNPRTMQVADAVYGVTMQEPGVSTIVGVRLGVHETV